MNDVEITTVSVPRDPEMVAIELRALHAWALVLNELDPYVRELALAVDAGLERQMLRELL